MRTPLPLAIARRLVRTAARLVPPARRADFAREWEGELAGEVERGAGWSVVGAALGAFADARAMTEIATRNGRDGRRSMAERTGAWTRDVGIALRGMRRSPGFTAVAVVTLALGIGGTAAIWTLLDRVVLDPLPYPESGRLVRLDNQVPGVGPDEVWALSTAQYVYFTDHASTLDLVGVYRGDGGNVLTASGPRRVLGVGVTASMMPLLGARASLGRVLLPSDDTPAAPPVAVLSHGFWERALGADPGVAGTTLELNGQPIEVVGVLADSPRPPGWPPSATPDLWIPLQIDRAGVFQNNHAFQGIARLRPGETPASVEAEIGRLTAHLPEAFPQAYSQRFFDRYGFRTRVTPLKESLLGDLSEKLWVLFGGVGVVLLIACANVANLFLVRMEGRRRELAVRSALGAGRAALARFVLAEAMTLSFLGAALALLVGFWAVPALTALAPEGLAPVGRVGLGWSTVAFTLIVSIVVGSGLAAYPLLARVGIDAPAGELSGGGRGTSAGPARRHVRSALVVTQVALALTLVIGSGLLVRTLSALGAVDIGFDPNGVLVTDLFPDPSRYRDPAAVWSLQREVLERVRAIPGVAQAGFGTEVPVDGGYGCWVQGFEDETVYKRIEDAGLTTCAGFENVTPGYFEALGIPLLEGRYLTEADIADPDRRAVVVSRAFADRFWPGQEALGQGVIPGGPSKAPFHHVVGVVGDVPASSAEGQPPLSQTAIAIYYPGYRYPPATKLVVKAAVADPISIFPAIRRVVSGIDPEMPLGPVTDMDAVVRTASAQLSFVSLLLGIAAGTALLLAAVGLYGVVSWVVTRRTREIGMRMAVGARPGEVQRMVVAQSVTVVGLGLAAGVALALVTTRVLDGLLVGVAPSDPFVYVAAAGLLGIVALAASWLPARRAARIDPLEALRTE